MLPHGYTNETTDDETPCYTFSRLSLSHTADNKFRLLWEDAQQRDDLQKKSPCQYEQLELWFGEKKEILHREYVNILKKPTPATYLHEAAETALYLFREGRPPKIWTVGGEGTEEAGFAPGVLSIHGGCIYSYKDADVLILTEKEHDLHEAYRSSRRMPPKLVVVRDNAHQRRRPAETTEEFLEAALKPSYRQRTIEAQQLGKRIPKNPEIGGAVTQMLLRDAVELWNKRTPTAISVKNAPLNFLNISYPYGHWDGGVSGVHKNFTLLTDVLNEISMARNYHSRKQTMPQKVWVDLESCLRWRILAQRGAVSSWHIDQSGFFTWVHLEGNKTDYEAEMDHDVVKLWAVFPMDQLSPSAQKEALAGFANYGTAWDVTVDGGIPVLALFRGDQYIQPPFTIHAPITLTDCKFEGGMAWKKGDLLRTLRSWKYTSDNAACTNEEVAHQTQVALHSIRSMLESRPSEFNIFSNTDLEWARATIRHLHGKASKCDCTSPCNGNDCPCREANHECGIYCHGGTICRCFWAEDLKEISD